MTPRAHPLNHLVQQLCHTAGSPQGATSARRITQLASHGVPATAGGQWVCLLGEASPVRMNVTDEDEEAQRMEALVLATTALVQHGANPLPRFDHLMGATHRVWIKALVDQIIQTPRLTDDEHLARGETLLHRLALRAEAWPEDLGRLPIHWPAHWVRKARSHDGATPLHLTWSLSEGIPKRILEPNNRQSWVAFEMLEDAIGMSRHLLEVGAQWDDMDAQGVTAGERMLMAFDAGLSEHLGNSAHANWMHDTLDQQGYQRKSKTWRQALGALAKSKKAASDGARPL